MTRCRFWTISITVSCVLSLPVAIRSDQANTGYDEADFLTRVRRLTFEGARAGEGYFSPSGNQLVFQSEREPSNPFYQIYLLDLETGDSQRISPGHGKTTCGFFQPGASKILFSSTHHDPNSCKLRRYRSANLVRSDVMRGITILRWRSMYSIKKPVNYLF